MRLARCAYNILVTAPVGKSAIRKPRA